MMPDAQPLEGVVIRGDHMVCPVCNCEYVHPTGAWTKVGTDPYEADEAYEGTAPMGVTALRRSALTIGFTCENGHRFAVVLQAHKGLTYPKLERWQDATEDEHDTISEDFQRWSEQADARVREHRQKVRPTS